MKIKSLVEKDIFIKDWSVDQANSEIDINATDRIQFHANSSFFYYEIELEESDINKLYLPHHIHGSFVSVPPSGMSVSQFGQTYSDAIYNYNQDESICIRRIKRALEWFGDAKGVKLFMYVSNAPNLAVKGHYMDMGNSCYYAGSTHKFAAYSAWIMKNGFVPLTLYMASETALS
jgi:hypothetical protein